MAILVDVHPSSEGGLMNVFHAPSGSHTEMAEMVRKLWEGSGTILVRVCNTREQAFAILGGMRNDLLAHIKTFREGLSF